MDFRLIRALLVLAFWFSSSSALGQAPHFSVLRSFELDGETFTAMVISPETRVGNFKDLITDSEVELAYRAYEVAVDWVFKQHKLHWPDIPDRFFEGLRLKQRDFDGRLSMIVVMRGHDMQDIVATYAAAWPTEDKPLLPGEKDMGFKPTRVKPHKVSIIADEAIWLPEAKARKAEVFVGSAIEIKNLVLPFRARHDFFPLVAFIGEMAEVSNHLISTPVEIAGKNFPGMVEPAEVVIFPHKDMIPYYETHGYRLVKDAGERDGNVKMMMTRAEYRARIAKFIVEKREGFKDLARLNWAERDLPINFTSTDAETGMNFLNMPISPCLSLMRQAMRLRRGPSNRYRNNMRNQYPEIYSKYGDAVTIRHRISSQDPSGLRNNLPKP